MCTAHVLEYCAYVLLYRPYVLLYRRYIYLWIKYALFEELDAGDVDRAREVYRAALKLVPHQLFTFSKVIS